MGKPILDWKMRRRIKRNLQHGISYSEIGRRTGVNKSTIRQYAIKFNLPSQHKKSGPKQEITLKPTVDFGIWFLSLIFMLWGILFLLTSSDVYAILPFAFILGSSFWIWMHEDK